MKTRSVSLFAPLLLLSLLATSVSAVRPYASRHRLTAPPHPIFTNEIEATVARMDFYALTATWRQPAVAVALASDPVLSAIRLKRSTALQQAIAACSQATCLDAAMRWSDADIVAVGTELSRLYAASALVRHYTEQELRHSGRYPLYRQMDGNHLLCGVWIAAARAMNQVLDVYGDGAPARYPVIDSMRYDPRSPAYAAALRDACRLIATESAFHPQFFYPVLKYAIVLLTLNDRLGAARFDQLESEANAPAVRRLRTVAWSRFRYSVILVPGAGPDDPNTPLSPRGRDRLARAVHLFREGKAPFLLVSGGAVHPMLTKYCEAVEMRRELMQHWKIPADAILIDPLARHTTTNLRNAAREVIRYGFPLSRPMLISTDAQQTTMILSSAFAVRCQQELGLRPFRSLRRLSPTEIEMKPDPISLQVDAMDPLDP